MTSHGSCEAGFLTSWASNWMVVFPVLVFLILLVSGWVEGAAGQVPDVQPNAANRLSPDRPGFSTGTHTVTPGRVYLEMGVGHSIRRGDSAAETQGPELTLRTGLLAGLEIFLEWDGWVLTSGPTSEPTPGPVLGTKVRFPAPGALDLTGLLWASQEGGGEARELTVLVGLMSEIELDDRWALFGGIQATSHPDAGGRVWDPAGALGFEVGLWERWAGLLEFHSHHPPESTSRLHGVETGLLFFPRPWAQVDLHIGKGSGRGVPPWFGGGLSVRR